MSFYFYLLNRRFLFDFTYWKLFDLFTIWFLALTISWQWSFSACKYIGSTYFKKTTIYSFRPAAFYCGPGRARHVEIYVKLLLCRYILISSMALCLAEASDQQCYIGAQRLTNKWQVSHDHNNWSRKLPRLQKQTLL